MPSGSEFIRQIKSQITEIDPAEVNELAHEGVAIVDVRETEETESGLLPGALIRNASLRFICTDVFLRVETSQTPVSSELVPGEVVEIPVKHGEGQYIATTEQLRGIEGEGLVVFRYVDARGEVTEEANPNGSLDTSFGNGGGWWQANPTKLNEQVSELAVVPAGGSFSIYVGGTGQTPVFSSAGPHASRTRIAWSNCASASSVLPSSRRHRPMSTQA